MVSEERIAELENEVRQATLLVAALVEQAGGKVTLSEELLVRVDPRSLVTTREDGGFGLVVALTQAPAAEAS